MFSSKKRAQAAAAQAQARQEAALRGAGLGISPSLANRKEHERTTSASTTASRATGLASPPLRSPIFGIPPPPSPGAARQWNGKLHERTESNSTSTTATATRSLESPKLGLTFDFELPPSPALSSGDAFGTDAFFRPSTSDGPIVGFGEEAGRKSSVTAPILPSVSQASNRTDEYDSGEELEVQEIKPFAAVQARVQRIDEPVQRVQDLPRKPKAPPPPTPIAPPSREQKSLIPPVSPPSQPLPVPPQLPSEKDLERSSSPALELPPRLSSRTPSAERVPKTPSPQPPKQSQVPVSQIPKQNQIPIPPPPSIPPPEIPLSKQRSRDQSDTVSLHSNKSTKSKRSRIKSFFFDKPNPDFLSQSRPSSSAGAAKMSDSPQDLRPSTSAGSTPMMESSLFPRKEPPIPRQDSMPIMNRAWLDARDKPYQNAAAKPGQNKQPYLQQTQSTPDLLAASRNPSGTSRSPLNIATTRSPLAASASAEPSPQSPHLTFVRPAGTFPKTSMSAEEEVAPSPTVATPTVATPTVGTPYQQTSPEFPLPEHVTTRPKTAGASTSTMGGVSVPTHYSKSVGRPETSAGGKADEKSDKKERRKTRLLNPMNLLSRRKSGEDEEVAQKEKAVQAAQVQALRKQKTVVTAGVNRVPENYDPRIRGKVVHDFSAPRHGRGRGSYSSDGPEPAWNAVARGLQSAQSAPFLSHDGRDSQASGSASGNGKHLSVSTMATSSTGPDRRSRNVANMGAFHEHLSETPDRGSRISSLQAERRENKDFLQRASHLSQQSQESGVLPPFARRNQAMDYHDSADSGRASEQSGKISALSNRWQDNRDSGVSAFSGVSPITARTSSAVGGHDTYHSFSPVSPTSPGGYKLASDGTPGSTISPQGTDDRPTSSYFSVGPGSKSSRQAVSPLEHPSKTASPARSPARSPGDIPKEEPTSKKDKKKSAFSIKIPFRGGAPDLPPRGPSAASANSSASPITSPTSRSVKSVKSAKSGRSTKSARSLAGTPSLHSLPSNVPTPEPQIAEPAIVVTTSKSPKLVEKLATAVGHGKRSASKKDKLEHQASNASRFSFQFGGSAAEELALEEKARKMRTNGETLNVQKPMGDDDDEDFFDEDAMDDMDEMEMQAQSEDVPGEDGYVTNYVGGKPLTLQQQVQLLQAQQARLAQQQAQPQQPMQQTEQTDALPPGASSNPNRASQFMYRNATPTSKASPKLQLDIQENDSGVSEDDDDPDAESDDESGYWAHDDFMDYSQTHTREPSIVTAVAASPAVGQTSSPALPPGSAGSGNSPQQPRRQRGASAASAHGLTLNTNVGPSSTVPPPTDVRAAAAAFVQDAMSQQARSGFYMQPAAAGYSNSAANLTLTEHPNERPVVPHRDSGNSERNRAASGLNFGTADDGAARHKAALSSSTLGSAGRSTVSGSSSSGPRTTSTGLGLSVFSDFKFTDSAPPSRPLSLEKAVQDRRSGDSETIPRDVNWTEGSPALNQHGRSSSGWTSESNGVQTNGNVNKNIATIQPREKTTYMDIGDDDVYFDDGGFDLDIAEGPNVRGSVNESAFDEDGFDFDRINGVGQAVRPPSSNEQQQAHSRAVSALTVTSLGSDGPYPSFAMPNAAKARQRDSTYLLEDLPLQEGPVDPRLIPRRNPSEDAKRLGLSDKVPPLPAQPGNAESTQRVSSNLQAYHSALAAAANKAAAEGRFSRMPSISTTSVYSQGEDGSHLVSRDASHYSRNEDGDMFTNGHSHMDRSESVESSHSRMGQDMDYTSSKMNFDFGFGSGNAFEDDLDDLENDDDIVAAANAEALASDDEGFYGQEFGFYAKARPNSGEVQALIGGYFGEDGDDGLTRNRSTKEPNLTPITERSEFSTRNSFIGMGAFGPASAGGPMSAGSMSSLSPALARLPYSPLVDGEVTNFDQLRKLRAHAFGGSNASLGGSNGSLHSAGSDGRNSNASLHLASDSPTWSARSSAAAQGYFGGLGGAPMALNGSSESERSSNAASANPHPTIQPLFHDSPHSAASSGNLPFSMETDATPKKAPPRDYSEAPLTVRKAPPPGMGKMMSHSRKSSKDSVTYVQEQDPAGTGQPRWVLERRRTSEQGQLELVAREIVQGGWI